MMFQLPPPEVLNSTGIVGLIFYLLIRDLLVPRARNGKEQKAGVLESLKESQAALKVQVDTHIEMGSESRRRLYDRLQVLELKVENRLTRLETMLQPQQIHQKEAMD